VRLLILVSGLIFLFSSCEKPHESKPKIISSNSLAADFNVPEVLFKVVKDSIAPGTKTEPEYIFTNLEVEIHTDQKNVLSYSDLIFKLSNGGGSIDLKDYVTGEGSFYLNFPPEQFETKPELAFIFYLSDSPKVAIRGEEYGLGCGQWVDLKPKFEQLKQKKFLKLNTVDHTYAHVLSGQYLFVFKKGIQYYVTHLNLLDSRYGDKMCSAIFNIKK
jgi:hypothetical protein